MSEVSSAVEDQAVQQMIGTLHTERAKLKVQRIANGHTESDLCGVGNFSYAVREQQLIDAEERLHKEFDN